jgi:hypothetical protein
MGEDRGAQEVALLEGELARIEGELKKLMEFVQTEGFSTNLGKQIKEYESQQAVLLGQLETAQARLAHPLSDSWNETRTLIGKLPHWQPLRDYQYESTAVLIEAAEDPNEIRLQLRSALRRVIESIWMVVTTRGKTRLAMVEVYFKGSNRCRVCKIMYRPARSNQHG